MKAFRYVSWFLRAVLFLLLLLFALKNTDSVTLRFFFGESWQLPLVLLLLIFFVFGAVLGLLACLPRIFRERREILALKRDLKAAGEVRAPIEAPVDAALPPGPGV